MREREASGKIKKIKGERVMDIVEPSTDWIEFDAETDEVPFLHMHDMIEVKYIDGIDLSSPVPAWSVDFDRSRDPVVAYRVIKKADVCVVAASAALEVNKELLEACKEAREYFYPAGPTYTRLCEAIAAAEKAV